MCYCETLKGPSHLAQACVCVCVFKHACDSCVSKIWFHCSQPVHLSNDFWLSAGWGWTGGGEVKVCGTNQLLDNFDLDFQSHYSNIHVA